MDASLLLDVLSMLLSLVAAVGVLVVNGKVDRLSGEVSTLKAVVAAIIGRSAPPVRASRSLCRRTA